MVEVEVKVIETEIEKEISGPTKKPPKDPNSAPEPGISYESKEEFEKNKNDTR